jgi:hypothetical protein
MTTPHVKVQVTLDPGETRELKAELSAGDFRLRTLEIGGECNMIFATGAFPEVIAETGSMSAGPAVGEELIRFTNNEKLRRTLIIESRDWVCDALTAHQATTMQAFRNLFADTVLGPGDEVRI